MAHGIGGSRRTTELLLLCAGAIPVLLLYSMYVMNTGAQLSLETLAVPIGLIVAFVAAHIAERILAPGADPAILPIVFVLSGIGITFVTRLAPEDAMGQVIWLFVSVAGHLQPEPRLGPDGPRPGQPLEQVSRTKTHPPERLLRGMFSCWPRATCICSRCARSCTVCCAEGGAPSPDLKTAPNVVQ